MKLPVALHCVIFDQQDTMCSDFLALFQCSCFSQSRPQLYVTCVLSPKWCESSVKADSACKLDVPQRQHLVVVVVALSLSGTPKTTSYMVVALSLSGTPKTTSYMVVALEWSKAASILYSHQFVSYWTQEYSSFETRRFVSEM